MYNVKEHFYISKVTEQLPLSIKLQEEINL